MMKVLESADNFFNIIQYWTATIAGPVQDKDGHAQTGSNALLERRDVTSLTTRSMSETG
jgi:hypothetical protein